MNHPHTLALEGKQYNNCNMTECMAKISTLPCSPHASAIVTIELLIHLTFRLYDCITNNNRIIASYLVQAYNCITMD